jgi:hypothetical protein
MLHDPQSCNPPKINRADVDHALPMD